MDEKILVTGKTLRVTNLIDDGEQLVRKLEEKNFPISAAFLRYLDDEGLWRLVIVSPVVGQEGPLNTYMQVNNAVDELGSSVQFGLSDISVMSPSWSQFRDLRRTLESAGLHRIAAAGQPRRLGGVNLPDFYVYRWNPDLTSS
ncbi:MAG: hypothetical protein ACRD3O_20700 [Terriglobia bacterium]